MKGFLFAAAICLGNLFVISRGVGATPTTAPSTIASSVSASTAVQVDVSRLLNARVVTTFTDGKVVPFTVGIDELTGLATNAAVKAIGSSNEHNLPSDGHFPANADHPEVVLHYSDADGVAAQVRRSPKGSEDDYSFEVPALKYARMFLFFTSSSSGAAPLTVRLTYEDGSTDTRNIIVPDWYKLLTASDKDCVYLASDLAKWTKDNMLREKDHHSICGIDVHPASDKKLTQINIHKTHPIVIFWGATGQPVIE